VPTPPRAADVARPSWFVPALLLTTAAVLAARVATLPRLLEHFDGAAFAAGVESYSVVEMRPFWPGYPVYILLGKLFRVGAGDANRALHLLSAVASTLALWPLALLARGWAARLGRSSTSSAIAGLTAALLWAASPLSWIAGTEVFSDPTGLCLALFALWACWRSTVSPRRQAWSITAGALAGLTVGARLAYASLLLPLAFAGWRARRGGAGTESWRSLALGFALATLAWAGWQWSVDGSGLVGAARFQLGGHYGAWGLSVATDPDPLTRPMRLASVVLGHGFGAALPTRSWLRFVLGLAIVALGANGIRRLVAGPERTPLALAACWVAPYVAAVLLNFDPGYPRLGLPLVAAACIVLALGLPARPAAAWSAGVLLATALAALSAPVAARHRDAPRMAYRLTEWARRTLDPTRAAILVTPEAESFPVVDLRFFFARSAPGFWTERVASRDLLARARALAAQGYAVHATASAAEAPGDWRPVARACREDLIETRGPDEVWIFAYDPGGVEATSPPCL
jgi:hypothetical protein